jgi:hypothetical protein
MRHVSHAVCPPLPQTRNKFTKIHTAIRPELVPQVVFHGAPVLLSQNRVSNFSSLLYNWLKNRPAVLDGEELFEAREYSGHSVRCQRLGSTVGVNG